MPCTPILLVYRPPTSDYRQPLFSPRNTRTTQRGLRPQPKPTLAKTQRTPRRQDRDALTLCALGVFARDISPCISISYVRCFPKSSRENKIRTGSSTEKGEKTPEGRDFGRQRRCGCVMPLTMSSVVLRTTDKRNADRVTRTNVPDTVAFPRSLRSVCDDVWRISGSLALITRALVRKKDANYVLVRIDNRARQSDNSTELVTIGHEAVPRGDRVDCHGIGSLCFLPEHGDPICRRGRKRTPYHNWRLRAR